MQTNLIEGPRVRPGSIAMRYCWVMDNGGGISMFLTAFGKPKAGPRIKALFDAAKGDEVRQERIYGFVEVWHELEWTEMREPEETP